MRSGSRLVLGLVLGLTVLLAPAAGAQDGPTTLPPPELPVPHIIPEPNSGHAPDDAGDRGGALQLAVLGVVVLGLAGGVVHVVRQAKRATPR